MTLFCLGHFAFHGNKILEENKPCIYIFCNVFKHKTKNIPTLQCSYLRSKETMIIKNTPQIYPSMTLQWENLQWFWPYTKTFSITVRKHASRKNQNKLDSALL